MFTQHRSFVYLLVVTKNWISFEPVRTDLSSLFTHHVLVQGAEETSSLLLLLPLHLTNAVPSLVLTPEPSFKCRKKLTRGAKIY